MTNTTLIIISFTLQVILSVAIYYISKLCSKFELIITKDDALFNIFNIVYSKGISRWIEMESFVTSKFIVETVGNRLQSKYIPYIATSLTTSIILKLVKCLGNEKDIFGFLITVDLVISILIVIISVFFLIKSFNYRKIDKLEYFIKKMSGFIKEKQSTNA